MTVTVSNLIIAKFAENVQTTQYTSADGKTIIDKFTATNTGLVDVVFTINLVPSTNSPGDNNAILFERTIAPGETYLCGEVIAQVLALDDYISTIASIPGVLTIKSSGRVIS